MARDAEKKKPKKEKKPKRGETAVQTENDVIEEAVSEEEAGYASESEQAAMKTLFSDPEQTAEDAFFFTPETEQVGGEAYSPDPSAEQPPEDAFFFTPEQEQDDTTEDSPDPDEESVPEDAFFFTPETEQDDATANSPDFDAEQPPATSFFAGESAFTLPEGFDTSEEKDDPDEPVPEPEPVPETGKKRRKSKKDKASDAPMLIDLDDVNASELLEHGKYKRKGPLSDITALNKIPIGVYAGIVAILVLAVVFSGITLFMRINNAAGEKDLTKNDGKILLNNDNALPNSLNYIFCEVEVPLGGGQIQIKKLSFDGKASVIYFSKNFDFTRYGLTLTDNFGNRLGFDASYIEADGTAAFPENAVRFEPLTYGVRDINLAFTDLATGESASLDFTFTSFHGKTAEKSMHRLSSLKDRDGRLLGTVYGMDFASTGTTLFFSMELLDEHQVRFDPDLCGSTVSLTERGKEIKSLRNSVFMLETEDSLLCRADLQPIAYLSGSVDFTFSRLFMELPLSGEMDASQLYYNTNAEKYTVLQAGDYKVVLERILKYTDNSLQLVFHAEDMAIETASPSDRSNRREVLLDCEMIFEMNSGETVRLNATGGQSRDVGANVFFKTQDSPYAEDILAGRYRSSSISIKSALIRLDDVTFKVNLDGAIDTSSTFEDDIRTHLKRENANKDQYSAAVLAYERLDLNHRAVLREVWRDETGSWHTVTRLIYGFIDPYTIRLEEDVIIAQNVGLR